MPRHLLPILLALGACAAPIPPPLPPRLAYGTIVSVRTPPPAAGPGDSEFVVREDNGAIISVMQADAAELRPGERVAIAFGPRPSLTRTAPGT